MRPLYLILKIVLNFSLRIYYKRHARVRAPKNFVNRTIYASNHPSSFMDPLIIAVRQNPIVHFMTRGDIYKGVMKQVFWSAHMLPIYRNHDGEDAVRKNQEVFDTAAKELRRGRGIIMFAEGFTDDKFIRRLKPVKKGSVRLGFEALEKCNWKKEISMQAVGLNYTNPKEFRSEILVAYGPKICLNDYKEVYLENSGKTISEITKRIEKDMRDQITHVDKKEWCSLHEGVMSLTRKGMNNENKDESIPLKKRWEYSRNLALWMNEHEEDKEEELDQLKEEVDGYFSLLKKSRLQERFIYEYATKGKISLWKNYLLLFLGFPFALLGLIHGAPSYFIIKPLIEKAFRRDVFWSSVKMVAGLAVAGIYNILFIFLVYYLIYPNWWVAIGYYFVVPGITFVIFHYWWNNFRELKIRKILQGKDLGKFVSRRTVLLEKIKSRIPVA